MKFLNIIPKKSGLFFLLILPVLLMAQPKDNSPYSRYGFGEIQSSDFIYSQSMGGLGASYVDPFSINIVNPASLSYLAATAFDVGLHAEYTNLSDGQNTDASLWTGNLSYMSLAFPLQNNLNDLLDRKVRDASFGMAFTLKPYSTVGYNIETIAFDDNIGRITSNDQGSGGSYDFTWSNGARWKNFAAGINLGYLFGKTTKQRISQFPDNTGALTSLAEETSNYSGFIYRIGLMYNYELNKEAHTDDNQVPLKRLSFGIHTNSKTNFSTEYRAFTGSFRQVSATQFLRDTLSSIEELDQKGKLPSELGIGMTYYSGDKLALGINYTSTKWSQFSSPSVNEQLNDVNKLSFGGYYRPNYKSIGSYLSRVMYRFGAYYNQIPTNIVENQGEQIDDIGLSFGMSLPFWYQRKISHAHIGVAYGVRGRNTVIQERYTRLTFSFTFNDNEWFIKRKYN